MKSYEVQEFVHEELRLVHAILHVKFLELQQIFLMIAKKRMGIRMKRDFRSIVPPVMRGAEDPALARFREEKITPCQCFSLPLRLRCSFYNGSEDFILDFELLNFSLDVGPLQRPFAGA